MTKLILCLVIFAVHLVFEAESAFPDWLVTKIATPTQLIHIDEDHIRLTNGLISRDFVTKPDFATIDFYSHAKDQSILRAISPEAVVTLDGINYDVGGLTARIPRGYLNRTALAENIVVDPSAFHYAFHSVSRPKAPFPYRPRRYAPADIVWPPAGLRLDVLFKAPESAKSSHQSVTVTVHYEMYDGIPLLSKWVTISQLPGGSAVVRGLVNTVEYLAVNWEWSKSGHGWLHVENDLPHTRVNWVDKDDSRVGDMAGALMASVNSTYLQFGLVPLTSDFISFRVHELVVCSSDPERLGLAVHRKMRLLAPHTQETNIISALIFFHSVETDSPSVRKLIDQLSDVRFEMLIFSFFTSFDMESHDEAYLDRMRRDVSYANSKGIEVGGYDLIAWTRVVQKEWTAVGGEGACMASGWYDYLLERTLNFINRTGVTLVETDGPYPGYECKSTNHSHHKGRDDSIYWQLKLQSEYYKVLRGKRIYIHQPDEYFYQEGNKNSMGYNESQFSLPRWQDISISRQRMFDDTYHYIPTAGWMFMPLVQYHGGGDQAIFEPLSQHIVEYEWGLAQYFGAGVGACYRGYRLYDTNETRSVVIKWVSFYKKYRDIGLLTSDIVHVRRADMQGIDCYMHVNPFLTNKGLAMVFNPTQEHVRTTLTLPLYYTGLTEVAVISEQAVDPMKYRLDRMFNVEIPIDLKPLGITWILIQ